jgi:excisionase family DNA binding protein
MAENREGKSKVFSLSFTPETLRHLNDLAWRARSNRSAFVRELVRQAAEYSGYDVQYVRRLARQSKIGAVKKGRDWWIDVEEFTAYLRTMIESKDGRAGPKPMLQEDP